MNLYEDAFKEVLNISLEYYNNWCTGNEIEERSCKKIIQLISRTSRYAKLCNYEYLDLTYDRSLNDYITYLHAMGERYIKEG